MYCRIYGVCQNQRYLLGGPPNKGYSISGSTLGSTYLGKLPYRFYNGLEGPSATRWNFRCQKTTQIDSCTWDLETPSVGHLDP